MQSAVETQKEANNTALSSEVAHYHDNYYRDGFRTILLSLAMIVGAIGLLIVLSLYFFLHQVLPITFPVYEDWRVQPDVPLERPYLHVADLLQWVSQTLPSLFVIDFINYNTELKNATPFFTNTGWSKFLTLTESYLNHDEISKNKVFVQATASGAPVILNQGVIEGKYGWWVQMPMDVRYSGVDGNTRNLHLVFQTLVVRVSTLDNLDGVAIDNMIINQG